MSQYCPNCGTKLNERSEYCPECGVRVRTIQKRRTSSSGRFRKRCILLTVLIVFLGGTAAFFVLGGMDRARDLYYQCKSSFMGESPEKTVIDFLRYYKNGNIERMSECILPSGVSEQFEEYGVNNGEIPELAMRFDFIRDFYSNPLIPAIASRMSYEVEDVNEEKNTAVVSVCLKLPDAEQALSELAAEPDMISADSDELEQTLLERIEEAELAEREFRLPLSRTEGEWMVSVRDERVLNGLSGGMLEGYQELYEQALEEIEQMMGGKQE